MERKNTLLSDSTLLMEVDSTQSTENIVADSIVSCQRTAQQHASCGIRGLFEENSSGTKLGVRKQQFSASYVSSYRC